MNRKNLVGLGAFIFPERRRKRASWTNDKSYLQKQILWTYSLAIKKFQKSSNISLHLLLKDFAYTAEFQKELHLESQRHK